MAEFARSRCGLDKVIFVPSFLPPHKNIRNLTSAQHRYQMVALATRGHPAFQVSDFEINRRQKSYTIETVRHFAETFSGKARLFFIVGDDNLQTLSTWRDIDEIVKLVTFIVVNRPGHPAPRRRFKHVAVRMPAIDISASFIRRCCRRGQSVKYFVPDQVLRYIEKNHLYEITP